MMAENKTTGTHVQAQETPQAEKKLQVHNLRISFRTSAGKVQAVRGISFDLQKGETLAIVGESGSGKSVTSKAILGIQAGNAITEEGEILYVVHSDNDAGAAFLEEELMPFMALLCA